MDDQNLFDKVTQMIEKREVNKNNHWNYEKGEYVRIFNHLHFLKNTDYIIYNLLTLLQKGI